MFYNKNNKCEFIIECLISNRYNKFMKNSIHNYDKLEQFDKKNIDWFVVNWCLGNTCNYTCSYCPDFLHDGSMKWQSTKNVKAFIERVKEIHFEKKIHFEFTGGEITLNKDFIEICKFCKSNDVSVGVISNGSRTIRWWEENKQYFDHVNLSFHVEYANVDHFCKVVEVLRFDLSTHVNVMMHLDRWDECLAVAFKIKAIGNASIALKPLIHDLADEIYDYTDEQKYVLDNQHNPSLIGGIEWTKRFSVFRGNMREIAADGTSSTTSVSPHEYTIKNTNNWMGWECWVGAEQLVVDKDGSIWRGWCKVDGLIGYIGDADLAIPTKPVVCDKNRCHCHFDIMSTKSRLPESV